MNGFGQFTHWDNESLDFSAVTHGHERAVRNAIRYMEDDVLTAAIFNDKKCKEKGIEPKDGWYYK